MIFKYLLTFVLIFSLDLCGESKIKAGIHQNGLTHVKFMLKSPMLTKDEAKWKRETRVYNRCHD